MIQNDALIRFATALLNSRNLDEARLVAVNESRSVLMHHQACLLEGAASKVTAVSDLAQLDSTSPFKHWAETVAKDLKQTQTATAPMRILLNMLSVDARREWPEFAPPRLLWLPVLNSNGELSAAMLISKETVWDDASILSAREVAVALGLRLGAFTRRSWISGKPKSILGAGMAALGLLAMIVIPVRLSILAPVEITPKSPHIITAPFDGILREITVKPDQKIATGDILAMMEIDQLENQLALAENALEIVKAELLYTQQSGFADMEQRAKLAELEAQVALKITERDYAADRLSRAQIKAPEAGIAIVQNPDDWQGRPVQVGERILTIADPQQITARVMLPVKDSIAIANGAPVRIFLDKDPLSSLTGHVLHAGFEPEPSVQGFAAYPITVAIEQGQNLPRIGLRGTARIKGTQVSLGYYLFRRPITTVRQWLGW